MKKPEIRQDRQTTNPDGTLIEKVPHGVQIKMIPTKIDDRGQVVEIFNPEWDIYGGPIPYAYCFTIRPHKIKGWGLHKLHTDRYFLIWGEMRVVLYDDRQDSPTYKMLSEIYLSHFDRRLLTIPPGIWHADQNVGDGLVTVINMPDRPYDRQNPDKYRLPVNDPYIPFTFETGDGW